MTNDAYIASTLDTVFLSSAVTGCDSMIVLDLTIQTPFEIIDSISSCGPYTWPIDGITYTNSTSSAFHFGGLANCDSVTRLVLAV
ncbi:MAG: hypothetical protein AB8B74_05090 [Crocinitomicaceae bacterium]